ncbi:hypothetical protein KY289_008215 [Solanum tuberosum]|nr:hypothetical protein KY289_008215 [Solanum tuberosum]
MIVLHRSWSHTRSGEDGGKGSGCSSFEKVPAKRRNIVKAERGREILRRCEFAREDDEDERRSCDGVDLRGRVIDEAFFRRPRVISLMKGMGEHVGAMIGEEPGVAIGICGEDVSSIGGLRKKRRRHDGRGATSFLLSGKKMKRC